MCSIRILIFYLIFPFREREGKKNFFPTPQSNHNIYIIKNALYYIVNKIKFSLIFEEVKNRNIFMLR